MHPPILYTFRRCPYAIRARMALLSSRTPCTVREVHLAHKPDALLEASPKGTVPVLVLPDGRVIDQSLAVMLFALEANDPEGWLAVNHDEALALIALNDGAFKRDLDGYKYPGRTGGDREVHRRAGLLHLANLEARLAAQEFLCGARAGYTDVALFPFVRQFAAVDASSFSAEPLPALRAWLAAWVKSPFFEHAMVSLKPWKPGDAEVRLGELGSQASATTSS